MTGCVAAGDHGPTSSAAVSFSIRYVMIWTTANWVDFLEQVDTWLPTEAEPVYAIVDNLSTHSAPDVLLFSLAHPRWEFVFQPTYAAYLNLIEPWWKVLRSLALKGRRFETWDEVCQAVEAAYREMWQLWCATH
jgi:hypothetical protein